MLVKRLIVFLICLLCSFKNDLSNIFSALKHEPFSGSAKNVLLKVTEGIWSSGKVFRSGLVLLLENQIDLKVDL